MPEQAAASAQVQGRESFGSRLGAAMAARGPLCVGIDPHPSLLSVWGLKDDVDGLRAFSLTVLDAVASLAAAVKPQVGLFQRHRSPRVGVGGEGLCPPPGPAGRGGVRARRGTRGGGGPPRPTGPPGWLSWRKSLP